MKIRTLFFSAAALVLLDSQSWATAKAIVVGYQSNVEPAKVAQADGVYDQAIGEKMNWRQFNSGAEVLTALASGSVDIALIGSSPLGAAVANNLPIEVFLMATDLKSAEALVVRNASGINKPQDLIGKKIAVPFSSTAHYSLLSALKHWNIPTQQVRLLNLKPAEINAAWQRGDIDAAFVWSPALAKIQRTGKVLTDAGQVGQWGAPTFEVWVARRDFAQQRPEILRKFADVTLNYYQHYNSHPEQWTASSPAAAKIAKITGVEVKDVPTLLAGAVYPVRAEQRSVNYLGGRTTQDMVKSVEFLKQLGLVKKVSPNYAAFVTTRFIQPTAQQKQD